MADFGVKRNDQPFLFAGYSYRTLRPRGDGSFIFNPDLGFVVGMVPQAKGRFRAYLGYLRPCHTVTWKGEIGLFTAESAKAVPTCRECYAEGKCLGRWPPLRGRLLGEHPYKNGVA